MNGTHMPPDGSGTSSQPDFFQPETWTRDRSLTCSPAISPATRSATSSPGSGDGASPCASLAGPTTVRSGREAVPASRSALREASAASTTNGIYGHNSGALSPSDSLQSSLESRLRERLTGSVSCEVIWKPWDTPWGQYRWKPRARTRTISGIGIGLWPTMTSNAPAKDGRNEAGNSAGQVALKTLVLGMWSTIRASDGAKGGPNMSFGAGGSPLPSQVSTVGNTSNAPTENGGGSLHPEFAGWEMGYPPEWLSCAPSATPSTRARQRSS